MKRDFTFSRESREDCKSDIYSMRNFLQRKKSANECVTDVRIRNIIVECTLTKFVKYV